MLWANRLLFFVLLSAVAHDVGATRQHVFNFGPGLGPDRPGSRPMSGTKPAGHVPKVQHAFDPTRSHSGLFTPVGDLSALSSNTFTALDHPSFPRHSIRVKKSNVCDNTVNSYTGYIDVEARHLFFYFFESRNDPEKDDVIFWTNGGPGCSSSLGLFMELGPCRVVDNSGPKYHPESWNSNANIFFIDQPVGVGFSYAEYGESVSTTEEAAEDVAAFVAIFFEHFHQFKGRAFHMAGESYGGRYIPLFASAVYDQNAKLIKAGFTPVNLTSIMIGNGATEFSTMTTSYYDMACTPASLPPVLDVSTCVKMRTIVPRCERYVHMACIHLFDEIDCAAAMAMCSSALSDPFFQTGLNPYDISKTCEGPIEDTLCYPVTTKIASYLDQPSVRQTLGVDPSLSGQNFTSCSDSVNNAFNNALDLYHQTQFYVAALLDRGIKTLVYVGTYDWICNWVGNERWTLALEWSGKEAFVSQELKEWKVDGKKAGLYRSAGPFTFLTVDGAGHMVPYDKPVQSLEMVKRWLAGDKF